VIVKKLYYVCNFTKQSKATMNIKMIVGGTFEGETDVFYCDVECTQEEIDHGEHGDKAEQSAIEYGFKPPFKICVR
tara:strand:- start:2248 stop:2475 length:228 start_codon:yes stop_codon:yes gene_type:complete